MKRIIAAACFAAFVSCKKESSDAPVSEASPKTHPAVRKDSIRQNGPPRNIAEIKEEFAVLNAKLQSKQLDSTGFMYECAEISGEAGFYYEAGQLRMVKHFTADSHFSSVTSYYLKNDEIFFILKDDTVWSFDGGTAERPVTKDDISQLRVYLVNGNPVQCLQKEFTVRSTGNNPDPGKIPNRETECDVQELMKDYLRVLKNIDKKGKQQCL